MDGVGVLDYVVEYFRIRRLESVRRHYVRFLVQPERRLDRVPRFRFQAVVLDDLFLAEVQAFLRIVEEELVGLGARYHERSVLRRYVVVAVLHFVLLLGFGSA